MRAAVTFFCLLALAACDRKQPEAVDPANGVEVTNVTEAAAANATDFQPLGSDAVKDSIHRALKTGETQRWQDGSWSGYAVPSVATNDKGCREVRYTVDQRPEVPFESITACEAN